MKLQEIFAQQKYNTMKLRARSMSTKPRNVLEGELQTMSDLLVLITRQRDGLAHELTEYRKLIADRTARIVDLQTHIENFEGEEK
ncbi:hypothetical protein UFOVP1309_86 [uncultured Caudovirales phage]|uniref:Uncharacterized protein n=1 Tax=uncultured Caudovirales phage TaxID=2100421 RepID=A0A6J5RXQ7_9CAUD|nr:hypothetical protein UFOVP1309_86 [uncultured Caudovirales phage]